MSDQRNIHLRLATEFDGEFAFQVLKETIRPYAIATWGRWFETESREEALSDARAGKIQIIEVAGMQAGIMTVMRHDAYISLEQIYVLPRYQNKGVGTYLIAALLAEAALKKFPVRLHVLAVNPARLLYERLGFAVVEVTPERIFMEHAATF